MNQYETIFIVDCTLEEEAQKNTVEKLIQQMTDAGCEIDKVDEWGKKKLAYPINYKTDGYFVLVTFKHNRTSFPNSKDCTELLKAS